MIFLCQNNQIGEYTKIPDYTASPDFAGRAAGYTPLESTLAPDGYAVKAVASAFWLADPTWWTVHHATVFLPRTLLAGQRQVVSLYTRGLSWFTVQQLGPEAAREAQGIIRNAVHKDRSAKLSFQATQLQYGAMTNAMAYTWYERSGPTLFVSDAQHIVYVTGALTRQELISYAEGLEPLGSGASASPSPSP